MVIGDGVGDGLGDGAGVVICCLRTVFGRSWEKMSASVARALFVSVPNWLKGDAGAGLRRMCVRSCAASITKSAADVAGMVTR